MISLHKLSDEALAILRLFIRAGYKQAGDELSREALVEAWKGKRSTLDAGIADLAAADLAAPGPTDPPGVVLSETGAAFFRRYHFSCH